MQDRTPCGCAILLAFCLAACGDKSTDKSAPSAAPTAPAGTDRPVVIELGKNGAATVVGAEMTGEPTTCAAMKACCAASSDTNLLCGLARATDKATCESVLKEAQQYLTERKLAKPAGCP